MSERDEVANPNEILRFWFEELSERDWFVKSEALDGQIARRFAYTHLTLSRGVAEEWRRDANSRLAAIIVLDQFPRNIYRGSPLSFATDPLALREARLAVAAGDDQLLDERRRLFFYLPFEHSEDIADQRQAVELCGGLGDGRYLEYARAHMDVISRFGRFPHRNAILGRESTTRELEYLAQPGAGF